LDQAGDLDPARLVHLVAGDHADLDPALAALLLTHRVTPPEMAAAAGAAFWAARCRSRWIVLMRAISCLALRISLGVSRRSVADWKRRWNRFLMTSLSASASCSSLMPRYSAGFTGFMAWV